MKIFLPIFLLVIFQNVNAQITTSVIRANFGIEADLSANYYEYAALSGNDDWFSNNAADTSGRGVIDTTGAAAINAKYSVDPSFRKLPFSRSMSFPPFSVINNSLLIDALFVRDYHGDDSTVFAAGASKNGMSPKDWSCPVSQSIPDKNEILDMMVHVRRAGPATSDSLWMFGGISIENTTGDRYFDFEMYQTDITYNRSTLKFTGYGPDAGHTSWKFDAGGNITSPGDIIFSAQYGSSTLTSIEARVWIDKSSLLITPVAFNWTGSFDGASAGAQYGYAGISPKSSGAFYTGTENNVKTWAGTFQLIRGDNSIVPSYLVGQFMEFGVNLTKLGLDPSTRLGGNPCGSPFRKILVKTRASTSFTAALKDFVAPFDFFQVPSVKLDADVTLQCGYIQPTQINVIGPVSTSTYTWSTPDGHIALYNSDTSIVADTTGTYIVTQKLQSVCPVYATDTIVLRKNPDCFVLRNSINDLKGRISGLRQTQLNWTIGSGNEIHYFEIEKSGDGKLFKSAGMEKIYPGERGITSFSAINKLDIFDQSYVYYRIKIHGYSSQIAYSNIIKVSVGNNGNFVINIFPNPAIDIMNVTILSPTKEKIALSIYNVGGKEMRLIHQEIPKGTSEIALSDFQSWPQGIYSVKISIGNYSYIKKVILTK